MFREVIYILGNLRFLPPPPYTFEEAKYDIIIAIIISHKAAMLKLIYIFLDNTYLWYGAET